MRAVFRTDASSKLGIGHLMRCMTLASELRQHGCEILFVCRTLQGDMNSYLSDKGFQVCPITVPECQGYDWKTDASMTMEKLSHWKDSIDWLVVDHYALDSAWESAQRPHV